LLKSGCGAAGLIADWAGIQHLLWARKRKTS